MRLTVSFPMSRSASSMTSLALMPSNRRRLPAAPAVIRSAEASVALAAEAWMIFSICSSAARDAVAAAAKRARSAVRICALIWKLPLKRQHSA